MKKFSSMKMVCIAIAFCAATAVCSPAQTFTSLASFDGNTGFSPSGLVQGTNGDFYGTTTFGGSGFHDLGSVFEVTPAGVVTTLHLFHCDNLNCEGGGNPTLGLLLGADGNLYGLTSNGGNSSNDGTAFQITPAGKLTTIHSFCA